MSAYLILIDDSHAGQRIDNFLIATLKGVPHSRIYKALRKGEVRVNKGRVQATYKLRNNDSVRIPPIRVAEKVEVRPSTRLIALLKQSILLENNDFLVINKPVGLSVHAGTDVACGVIEAFRYCRPDIKNLSLVHRLDRDTSGCLLLAKNRPTLLALQTLQKAHAIEKTYALLVKGCWSLGRKHVSMPLAKNQLQGGERMVVVSEEGKPAETIFEPIQTFEQTTWVRAQLITGRTHQIRVHTAELGYPIVGDTKYGDREFNRLYRANRLFLHAEKLIFTLPGQAQCCVVAPVPVEFTVEG